MHSLVTDFTTRLRSAATEASRDYATGRGPATSAALAALDRSEALVDTAIANVREVLAPTKPEQLPLALTDASDVFGDDEPAWMVTTVERDAAADAAMRELGLDPDALAEHKPVDYIALVVAFRVGVAKGESERRPYEAVPGAGKAIRHSLHATGVKVPR